MSVTCKSLKIENDSLKNQIKALKGDFQNLEKILRGFETAADKGRHSCINEVEIQKHFEFYGKSYDDLNHFKDDANAELRKLKSRLNAIDEQVETIENSIEESQQYSYKYNLKFKKLVMSILKLTDVVFECLACNLLQISPLKLCFE